MNIGLLRGRAPRALGACGAFVALASAPLSGHATNPVTIAPPNTVGFTVFTPPDGTPGKTDAVEPSIGADWVNNKIMYQADLTTLQVTFNDTVHPASATWKDVSSLLTSQQTSDPILFTDPVTGRTIVSQLTGNCSLSEFTDSAGEPTTTAPSGWTVDQGCGPASGIDHQSVGGGPFHAPVIGPPPPGYHNAVYYCSQASAAAFCALSLTGGATYNSSVPIYSQQQCGGLHGHVRVGPDGTAIVPNQNCGPAIDPNNMTGVFPNQAAVVSTNNGTTWSVNVIPNSSESLRSDPAVAADANNKWYFGYESAVNNGSGEQVAGKALISTSFNDGTTWSPSVDVGAPFGIQNVTFPEVIAGDSGRAAYAFLGSTTPGDPEKTTWIGTWELYVALTYDGGTTWTISDLTPGDPVQRDCIFLAGTGDCPNPSKRNLYDFMDITLDSHGRVLVGYADACSGGCDKHLACNDVPTGPCNTGPGASTGHITQIARMTCGKGLLGSFDGAFSCQPTTGVPEARWAPLTLVVAAGVVGTAWIRRRRRVALLN